MNQSGPTDDHSQIMKSGTQPPPSGSGNLGLGTTHPVCGFTKPVNKAAGWASKNI
jgi:hypothetical protein